MKMQCKHVAEKGDGVVGLRCNLFLLFILKYLMSITNWLIITD